MSVPVKRTREQDLEKENKRSGMYGILCLCFVIGYYYISFLRYVLLTGIPTINNKNLDVFTSDMMDYLYYFLYYNPVIEISCKGSLWDGN